MIAFFFLSLTLAWLIANFLGLAIRNIQAHKFYKVRAPRLPVVPNPKIFSGHIFQVTWPGKNWLIIDGLHKKLGPTFGYFMSNQPWVSTTDVDLIKLIEVDQPHKHINRSKFGLPFKEFNKSIFQTDDDQWRRIRRAVAPALTNHKVRSDEVSDDIRSVLDQVDRSLRKKLLRAKEQTGREEIIINVRDVFQRYTLAVIFLLTYKKVNLIDFDAEVDPWVQVMDEGARKINNPIVAWSVMFPFLRPLFSWLIQFHRVGRLQAAIVDYIVEATDIHRVARQAHKIHQRRISLTTGAPERPWDELKRSGNYQRRFVDTIIDAFMEKKIKFDEFIGSALFLLLAGYETTADTITCLIFHLAHNPDIQSKLREVILKEGYDADYVVWCIYETVRWHPAVPLGTGRILGEDVEINGTFLPKNTFVMPSTWTIHRDPALWPNPDKFLPERWREQANFHPAAFMGFGLGPRNCVGGKLAVHEIKLVLKLLLSSYRIEKCSETADTYDFRSPGLVYTLPEQSIRVRLVPLYTVDL